MFTCLFSSTHNYKFTVKDTVLQFGIRKVVNGSVQNGLLKLYLGCLLMHELIAYLTFILIIAWCSIARYATIHITEDNF